MANSTICSPPIEAISCSRTVECNDPPMIHNRHPVAQPLRLIHIVRSQDNGAAGLLEPVDQVPQVTPRLRVETGGRLIEKQQLWIAYQGACHGQPLLLAAGQRAYARVALLLRAALCGSNLLPEMPW